MIIYKSILATFQIIKRLLPAKAVDRLRNINNKTIREYIDEDNMLAPWGGKDEYEFKFIPEKRQREPSLLNHSNNNNNNYINHNNNNIKKVSFSNPLNYLHGSVTFQNASPSSTFRI